MPSSKSPHWSSLVRAIDTDSCIWRAWVKRFSARSVTLSEPMLARPTCTIIESYSRADGGTTAALPGRGREVGGAYGFKTEAGMVQHHGHVAVLVEAGGRAERVGEIDAHHIRFQNGGSV